MTSGVEVIQQSLLRRALAARDGGRLHVRFHASVVDRYRALANAGVMRTRTVGRIAIPGRWSLDFGIAEGAGEGGGAAPVEVHVPFQDLVERLPDSEWEHWIGHLVASPASVAFVQMRMTPTACIDDGETQDWA
jgi:hypothetical protein